MNIIEKMATANRSYQRGVDFTPKGVVLHSIGVGQPSADRMATAYNVYQPNGQTVCVHAFLEPEKVVQIAPWAKTLGHVGGNANYTHIGVEMCEPSQIKYTVGATFTCSNYKAAQEYAIGCYNTAVELFAMLCKQFNIDPIKGIISHSEAYKQGIGSNHGDPEHLWRGLYLPYTMDSFRKAVKDKMEDENDMTEKEVRAIVKEMLRGENTNVPDWAKDEMAEAVELEITDGSRPLGYATRNEVALMVKRAVKGEKPLNHIWGFVLGKIKDAFNGEGK